MDGSSDDSVVLSGAESTITATPTMANEKKSSSTEKSLTQKRNYTRLDFTLEQEEDLIEFVRENPALYNPKEAQYKNRNYRDRLWNEYGERINKTGEFFLRI